MLALLPGLLCVCVTVPATKGGLFVLVQVGGWEWGLLGACFSPSVSLHVGGNKEYGVCQLVPFCYIPSPLLG